jgi:hypothetical protein
MSETSLRWALGMGALAAGIGLVVEFVTGWFQPPTNPTTVDREVQYVLVAGILLLLSLGVVLGLAYYAGVRAERDRPAMESSSFGDPHRESAWAGTIVMAAYWLVTTLQMLLTSARSGGSSAGGLVGQRLIIGLILLVFGYGLGALGGRAPAARGLLNDIATRPRAQPTPASTPLEDTSPAPGEPPAFYDHEGSP